MYMPADNGGTKLYYCRGTECRVDTHSHSAFFITNASPLSRLIASSPSSTICDLIARFNRLKELRPMLHFFFVA
jgi:hypothetical protein